MQEDEQDPEDQEFASKITQKWVDTSWRERNTAVTREKYPVHRCSISSYTFEGRSGPDHGHILHCEQSLSTASKYWGVQRLYAKL